MMMCACVVVIEVVESGRKTAMKCSLRFKGRGRGQDKSGLMKRKGEGEGKKTNKGA